MAKFKIWTKQIIISGSNYYQIPSNIFTGLGLLICFQIDERFSLIKTH